MRRARVFISSPSDVDTERRRIQRAVDRLNGEYADFVQLSTVRWETSVYSADGGFQDKIAEARDCDIVIGILWSRLGSPLPKSFGEIPAAMTGGEPEPFPSGTAYEILSSLYAHSERVAAGEKVYPDVFVFRKLEAPSIQLGARTELNEAQEQWERLEGFFHRWFRTADGRILRAFHTFAGPDELEDQCELLLRNWIKTNVTGASQIVWPTAKLGSPFRGLAAFDARHAPVFFGREKKIARTIELVKAQAEEGGGAPAPNGKSRDRRARPFLLVVGPSGAGKSSLVRAGLIPRLKSPGVVPGVDFWRVAIMRPGDRDSPLSAFADALMVEGHGSADPGGFGDALPEIRAIMGDPGTLDGILARNDGSAESLVLSALEAAERGEQQRDRDRKKSQRGRLLVLVDQLEDIFSTGGRPGASGQLAGILARLTATGRVWVIATLRGDLYERIITDTNWIALKDPGSTYDLARPGPEELAEIIRKSASAAGLTYERNAQTGMGLDEALLRDASGFDSLPLLQFTLDRLFERRIVRSDGVYLTFSAYAELGGLDGAIDQAAERALDGLGAAERDELPALLRQLAIPVDKKEREGERSGLSLTVRPVDIGAARRNSAATRLIDALIAQRILLASRDETGNAGTIQIAHQRVLESWKRARSMVAEHHEFYRIRDDVEQQYRRWKEGGQRSALLIPPGVAIAEAEDIGNRYRSEIEPQLLRFINESGRRARWRLRFFQSAAVVFMVLAAVAGWQRNEARTAQRAALANYETARGTVDRLISAFANNLSQLQDISIGTIETAYEEIDKAVDELGARAGKDDRTFDATRGSMALSFANLYKKTQAVEVGKGGSSPAVKLVNDAIELFRKLVESYPENAKYSVSLARAYALYSDLNRSQNLSASKTAALRALELTDQVSVREPGNAENALARSTILTRLGDIARQSKDFEAAQGYAEQVLNMSLAWYVRRAGDTDWARELSWSLGKAGEEKLRGPTEGAREALALFDRELCIRRRLSEAEEANQLYRLDVSWSLDRVGRAKAKLGDTLGSENALFEALSIRRTLLDRERQWRGAVDKSDSYILNDLHRIVVGIAAHFAAKKDWETAMAYLTEGKDIDATLYAKRSKRRTDPKEEELAATVTSALGEAGTAAIRNEAATLRRQAEYFWALSHKPAASKDCWPRVASELAEMAAARRVSPAPSAD